MSDHGTTSRYVSGCRCDLCRAAWATYWRERHHNNPEAYARHLARNRRSAAKRRGRSASA